MSAPLIDPDVRDDRYEPFWDGIQQEELRLPQCNDCGGYHWYPRPVCADCGSTDIDWTAISGRGTLYTWTKVRYEFGFDFFEDNLPWYTGLVQPAEDETIHLVAALDRTADEEYQIGMELEVTFQQSEQLDMLAPVFTPR